MPENLVLREYRKDDQSAIADIIRKTWKYDEFCSHKTARKLANVFLAACLANQTFTRVAFLQGEPVGIIMCKNNSEHHCKFSYRLGLMRELFLLKISKEGRQESKFFESINNIDDDLLSETKKKYGGEVAFFAVEQRFRGFGIGKTLFMEAKNYFINQKINDFFLFTDTSCNYGFYEHNGLVRNGEKKLVFNERNIRKEITFFLYEYDGEHSVTV
jgi:hypothetical protein